MENENNSGIEEVVRETVKSLVEKMNIQCDIETQAYNQENQPDLICNIKTKDSNYLIGQYGINLQALQHIARIIVRKKTDSRANFILDVNNYRQEKNESIAALAKNMAEKAIVSGRSVMLRPMSAYERRLVHMELSKNEKVKTESIGDDSDRRIVIKPISLI